MAETTLSAMIEREAWALEIDYWYEVDHNWGRNAAEFYLEDGVFSIGDQRMVGRAAVAAFYRWREGRGARTARHLISNFRIRSCTADEAVVDAILTLYAQDGVPPHSSHPANLIADVESDIVRDSDGRWRFRAHLLKILFLGSEAPTLPPHD